MGNVEGRPNNFLDNLMDTFGKVIAWGVMLIVVITIVSAIGIGMMRSKVKQAIVLTMTGVVDYARDELLDNPAFTQKIRENIKDAVEYSLRGAKKEILEDEAFNRKVRENVKEAVEYAFGKVKNEVINDVEFNQKLKMNTKEALEYLFDTVKQEAVTNGGFIEKVKTNVKEGIEFTAHKRSACD